MQDLMYSRRSVLQTLHALGFDDAEPAPRPDPDGDGLCHLCHAPYAQQWHGFVCPHWLVMPWPSLERIDEVLATYDVAAILHFLLVYTMPKAGQRRSRADLALAVGTSGAQRHVRIKARRRCWVFSVPTDPDDAASRLHFSMKAASSKEFATSFAPKDGDVALLRLLTRPGPPP